MIDKYFEWNIDGIQANTVLEGAEISVIIDKNNYKDIFINKDLLKFIKSTEDSIAVNFSYNSDLVMIEQINLSYKIKDNFYHIGYNYKDIFNNILTKLNLNEVVTVNEINNIDDYNKIVSEIKNEIRVQEQAKEHDKKESSILIGELYDNIQSLIKNMILIEAEINYYANNQIEEEKVLRENHKSLNNIRNKNISWKNLMYYTACKALNKFIVTDDIRYYRYAKNYYINVSSNNDCELPKSIFVDWNSFDCYGNLYNKKFISVQKEKFSPLLVKLNVEDKETVTRRKVLKNGKGMQVTISDEPKAYKKLDPSKVEEILQRKIKFYSGLSGKVQGIIDGLDKDTDYIGYVLENNYVIFDKFYETSKDGTKIIPAYGNRVYIATLDALDKCDYDRSKLRKYKMANRDYKVAYYNHTDSDSYQERIKEVLDYHDISTVKFKELKLRNENKKNN